MKPYVIAVDIGTTSTKTLLVNREGRILASYAVEYPLHTPRPEIAEQEPEQLFHAVVSGIHEVLIRSGVTASQILCVSFSSAMHSIIAVDVDGDPLTRCMTWADQRSVAYVDKVKKEYGGLRLYLKTGTPIHPMSPLLKIMWLKDHMPEIHQKAFKFIGIKEYVFAKLFGSYNVDYSIASATGLFNLQQLTWDEEALKAAGICEEQLSTPVPTTFQLSGLNPMYAEGMGLAMETPFVIGASDGVLANLGVGAVELGQVSVTIGTSGAVRRVVPEPITDPHGRLFCYALTENHWVVGGAINNGGIMLRWVRDELATLEAEQGRNLGMDPYDYLTQLASEVAPGSDGLIFLPFLAGERAPYWNANARGVFFGLGLHHHKKHMIRSVLEGVVYRIHSVIDALEQLSGRAEEIRASGGFARSPFWRQIMSDVLGTEVVVPDAIESSSLGAAYLGLIAMGEQDNFNHIHEWIRTGTRHVPNKSNHATYQSLTGIYDRIYHQLKDEFDAISAFQHQAVK